MCAASSQGCRDACLNTAGRGGMIAGAAQMSGHELTVAITHGKMNTVHIARLRKTHEYMTNRAEFMSQLIKDITRLVNYAKSKNLTPAIRLNATSDVKWETVKTDTGETIFERFPTVQFYDYTKIAIRLVSVLPPNYHLTFSLSESNDAQAKAVLGHGKNVAVVFRTKVLPATFMGYPVVNGDETDLRFLDASNVIVGLYAKGKAKKDTSGFVR
jgi:hypothetical protein